eukprot:TRINITY_DN60536_c0_g1_i1.p1 TRINITY_DN60536_c0_g1~~TRINITY_DN60536_c0_g1_i1.p1  ORF type:complete len:541 (-),score=102.83 TRINITY_DN60536_c0_g1_i1:163-1785(-)
MSDRSSSSAGSQKSKLRASKAIRVGLTQHGPPQAVGQRTAGTGNVSDDTTAMATGDSSEPTLPPSRGDNVSDVESQVYSEDNFSSATEEGSEQEVSADGAPQGTNSSKERSNEGAASSDCTSPENGKKQEAPAFGDHTTTTECDGASSNRHSSGDSFVEQLPVNEVQEAAVAGTLAGSQEVTAGLPRAASPNGSQAASKPSPRAAEQSSSRSKLATKESEQLSMELAEMRKEIDSLHKLVAKHREELLLSSEELERARAELDELRSERQQSRSETSKAEKDAHRQVEKLIKERQCLKNELENMQEQVQRMDKIKEKLEKRLRIAEKERDEAKRRWEAEEEAAKNARTAHVVEAKQRDRTIERRNREQQAVTKQRRPPVPKRALEAVVPMPPQGQEVWRFQPRWRGVLAIRMGPGVDASKTGKRLYPGEAFVTVGQERGKHDDMFFLKLADGRGWVFNRSPDAGTLCVLRGGAQEYLAPYRESEPSSRRGGEQEQIAACREVETSASPPRRRFHEPVASRNMRPRLPPLDKPVRQGKRPWH